MFGAALSPNDEADEAATPPPPPHHAASINKSRQQHSYMNYITK